MVYVRYRGNIRKAPRRRRAATRRATRYSRARPATRRRRVGRKQCVCPQELTPTAKFALAQIDPFDPKCQGAKVPDSNTIPSIANVDQDQVTLSSGASGSLFGIAFAPQYRDSYITTGTGASPTWGGSWQSRRNFSNVLGNIEGIRPVAHAVRLSSQLAPTTTTGFVHLGIAVESRRNNTLVSNPAPDFPLSVNEMTGLPHYKRITLASLTQSPITAINKWIDETAFRYDDPASITSWIADTQTTNTSALNFNQSWGYIVVMVEGAPASSSILSFEHILLTECIPRRNSFIIGSTPAPNSPGTMSAVSTMQSETDFVHTEAGERKLRPRSN